MLVTLTFDDGKKVHYTRFYPVLEKYGLKGTFYIVTSVINSPKSMTWQHVSDLYKHGNEIGSHTHTHPNLTSLSGVQLDFELKKSRELLEQFNATTLAYPWGKYDNRVIKYVKRYYSAARGTFSLSEMREHKDNLFRYNLGQEDERYRLKVIDPEFTFPPKTPLLQLPFSKFRSRMTKMLKENIGKEVWAVFAFHGMSVDIEARKRFVRNIRNIIIEPSRIVTITKRVKDRLQWKTKSAKDNMRKFDWLCEQLSAARLEVLNISETINLLYERKDSTS